MIEPVKGNGDDVKDVTPLLNEMTPLEEK